MKILSILLTSGMLALFSCSKRNLSPTLPNRVSKLTTTSTTADGSTTDVFINTYEYNTDYLLVKHTQKHLGRTDPPTVYSYTYLGGEIQKIESSEGSNSIWTNEGGRVKSIVCTQGSATYTSVFTYDALGRITEYTNTGVITPLFTTVITETYNYDVSGYLTSRHTLIANNGTLRVVDDLTLTGYDTKDSPYALLAEATSQPFLHDSWGGGVDAIILAKHNPGSGVSNGLVTVLYTYTYNAQGYPITITATNGIVTSVAVVEYINCGNSEWN